jgi:hypothetical protein
MGYMAIFLPAVSSAYMRQVYRTFVWSFVVQPNGSQLITGRLLRRCAPRNDI